MSEKIRYNHHDIIMAKFALALGLPVRIFIICVISSQNNLATKEDFYNTAFAPELINKHISQLKGLGIVKIKKENRKTTYSINKSFFNSMAENFSLLFKSIEQSATTKPEAPDNSI